MPRLDDLEITFAGVELGLWLDIICEFDIVELQLWISIEKEWRRIDQAVACLR